MNQNSNTRKIDELGRIVIPKDIRKKLHIKNNDLMEVYIDDETIKIQKYTAMFEDKSILSFLVDSCSRIKNSTFLITNREKIVYASDSKFLNLSLIDDFENYILNNITTKNERKNFVLSRDLYLEGYFNILPIITIEQTAGLIVEYSKKSIENDDLIKLSARFIEKTLND